LNDEEYRELLEAIGRRYLRLHRLGGLFPKGFEHGAHEIDDLCSKYRIVYAIAERAGSRRWYGPLYEELRYLHLPTSILDDAGVFDALDENTELVFAHLSRSVVPAEDIELLRRSGIEEAEAEVTIIVHCCRHLARSSNFRPSATMREAPKRLKEAIDALSENSGNSVSQTDAPAKPRRYFTGIGRILSGAVAGTGNVLLGVGAIPATGGTSAAAVFASSALAVGLVSQGIGDLRGE
jgi:hypothetical protein